MSDFVSWCRHLLVPFFFIKAGVDGVTITDEFGDGFLAREGCVCAGHSTPVGCLG